MGLLTAKIFVLHSGYASVTDKNFKNDDRIKKIITLQIQNELIPYTLFGTLPTSKDYITKKGKKIKKRG